MPWLDCADLLVSSFLLLCLPWLLLMYVIPCAMVVVVVVVVAVALLP